MYAKINTIRAPLEPGGNARWIDNAESIKNPHAALRYTAHSQVRYLYNIIYIYSGLVRRELFRGRGCDMNIIII